jgi:hypothetical protein
MRGGGADAQCLALAMHQGSFAFSIFFHFMLLYLNVFFNFIFFHCDFWVFAKKKHVVCLAWYGYVLALPFQDWYAWQQVVGPQAISDGPDPSKWQCPRLCNPGRCPGDAESFQSIGFSCPGRGAKAKSGEAARQAYGQRGDNARKICVSSNFLSCPLSSQNQQFPSPVSILEFSQILPKAFR